MTDVADLEHRFPKLWAAVQALVVAGLAGPQDRRRLPRTLPASRRPGRCGDGRRGGRAAVVPDPHQARGGDHAPPTRPWPRRNGAQAKSARFVQLCRSEDGINTMIVRADAGDLVMVYALVDRLADILDAGRQHRTRRPTAGDRVRAPRPTGDDLGDAAPPHPRRHPPRSVHRRSRPQAIQRRRNLRLPSASRRPTDDETASDGAGSLLTSLDAGGAPSQPESAGTTPPPDPRAEPPAWTADDYDEPPRPGTGRSPQHPRPLATTPPTQTGPGTTRPGLGPRTRRPRPTRRPQHTARPVRTPAGPARTHRPAHPAGTAALPGPGSMLNVYLTDQTLTTGEVSSAPTTPASDRSSPPSCASS